MNNSGDSDALLEASVQMASSDWRDDEDEDNFITARLYKTADGKHFRYIETSGMNSSYAGAGKIVEWLASGDVATWNPW
jgi:hypothetical protein